jgi:tRNA pseudouridine-54 N-methylase
MTKIEIIKDLKSIHGHLKKALDRTEKIAKKIDVPSHAELFFITQQVEQLIEMTKEKCQ